MSSISTTTPSLMPAGSSRTYRPFAALLNKELRESRAIIIVGLWSFWLMPIMIELLYYLFYLIADGRGDIATGIAWGALTIAGWLYAIVVGANVVCRDWGKPEEHFLASRPISARSIVASKLLAGLIVLFGVAMIAALWDLGVAVFDEQIIIIGLGKFSEQVAAFSFSFVVICIMTVGFLAAFAAAVVTRQMLTSVLVGVLVLLIWWVGPMLSRDLESFYPAFWRYDFAGTQWLKDTKPSFLAGVLFFMSWPYLLIVAGAAVACIATAFIAAPRERTLQVSHKTLAWGMAGVVLVMFGFAMNEVGASLDVSDNIRLYEPGAEISSRRDRTLFAQNNQECAIFSTGALIPDNTKDRWYSYPLISFRLDEEGQIQNLRQTDLLDLVGPGMLRYQKQNRYFIQELCDLKIDDKGDYIVTGRLRSRKRNTIEGLSRAHIRWPAGGEPEIVSKTIAGLPEEQQKAIIEEYNKKLTLTGYASTNRWAYLVYETQTCKKDGKPDRHRDRRSISPRTLYIFDWATQPEPKTIYEIPVPNVIDFMLIDDMLWIHYVKRNALKALDGKEIVYPADNPALIAEMLAKPVDHWWKTMTPKQREYMYTIHWLRKQNQRVAWNTEKTICFEGDRWGISVKKFTGKNMIFFNEVGRTSLSPIAAFFRKGSYRNHLKLIDDQTLLEMTRQTLSVYDVSDVHRPRRRGFFHLAHNRGERGQVFATDKHLLLLEGSYLTVLERPQTNTIK